MSETAKYLSLTLPYIIDKGLGVDIASQGASVHWTAISFDLPPDEFSHYCSGNPAKGTIHLRGHADKLPFDTNSLDYVYSSHLLEDYADWWPCLIEWTRVLKPGGNLIILVPDAKLWNEAIAKGQPPNCSHRHEARVGELSEYAPQLGLEVIRDSLTDLTPEDYSILFVARKV